jgi:osmotically-inducible protein OsmY
MQDGGRRKSRIIPRRVPKYSCASTARKALDERPTVPQGVHAHVVRGVVTLTGSVRHPFERAHAEDAVRRVEGIRSLVNDITVTQVPNPQGRRGPQTRPTPPVEGVGILPGLIGLPPADDE